MALLGLSTPQPGARSGRRGGASVGDRGPSASRGPATPAGPAGAAGIASAGGGPGTIWCSG